HDKDSTKCFNPYCNCVGRWPFKQTTSKFGYVKNLTRGKAEGLSGVQGVPTSWNLNDIGIRSGFRQSRISRSEDRKGASLLQSSEALPISRRQETYFLESVAEAGRFRSGYLAHGRWKSDVASQARKD